MDRGAKIKKWLTRCRLEQGRIFAAVKVKWKQAECGMEMVDALEETFSQFRRSSRFSSSASRKLEGRILATRWEGSISWRITDRREIRGRGWLGFFLTRNWTSVRAGEIAKGTETSSNWIRDISAPMIRFNQIAWPDIALLFRLKTRGLCTHFTACASFYFFYPIAERASRTYSIPEFYRIRKNSTVYLWKKKEKEGERERGKIISLRAKVCYKFRSKGATGLLWLIGT